MATNLTDTTVDETYGQLLHVDGGVTATARPVYSGNGFPTALKVAIGSVGVGNVEIQGNTITTVDANGSLMLTANGTGAVVIPHVGITGGYVQGINDLAIADGGTGASDAATARSNLGLGSLALQSSSAISVSGGNLFGTTIFTATIDTTAISGSQLTTSAISTSRITLENFAASQIANQSVAPNLAGTKTAGRVIWDSTNNKLKVAVGIATTSAWVDADGTNPVTPA